MFATIFAAITAFAQVFFRENIQARFIHVVINALYQLLHNQLNE